MVTEVKLSTIRQDLFSVIFTLINDNKPSGWTVLSAFPEDNALFPCIIINPAIVKPSIIGLDDSSIIVEDIEVEIEFYAEAKDGKEKIDVGRDNVQNTILSNTSSLDSSKLVLSEDPFDDSNADSFITNNQKINTAASLIKLQTKC